MTRTHARGSALDGPIAFDVRPLRALRQRARDSRAPRLFRRAAAPPRTSTARAERKPADEQRRAGAARRVHRRVGHRDADEVDQGQRRARWRWARSRAGARLSVAPRITSRKPAGQNDLADEPRRRANIAAGRSVADSRCCARPLRCNVVAGRTAGDVQQHGRAAAIAPATCATRCRARRPGTVKPPARPQARRVTAGLKCAPEICPTA